MKKYNFSAGPAILPREVIEEAANTVLNFNNSGLSILEVSHRGKDFVEVLDEALFLVNDILGLSDDYSPMFLTGGASSQFFMSAMNFLTKNDKAYYLDTGTWSTKAIKEAKLFGDITELASSRDKNYSYIPKGFEVPNDGKYLHITSNNTIFGTQFHEYPDTDMPLICDLSSDIFSRPIPNEKFGMIYAGAQKNMGPAGTTLVILRKDLQAQINNGLPTMLDYRTHITKKSSFNTPPVFPIYVSMLTMRWVKANGGLEGMARRNEEKADTLYNEIDRNSLFSGVASKEDRSNMNATFILKDSSLEEDFMKLATDAGCVGIKGHRSVGGFRASIYNAMDIEGINTLTNVMKEFEARKG